jgi:hypothetical protein
MSGRSIKMNLKKIPALICIWMVSLLMLVGLKLQARAPFPSADSEPWVGLYLAETIDISAVSDEGPQGIYVDTQGHDDNDGVVGSVTYNNQAQSTIHIDSIYVHGENITTQGRFKIDQNIYPGEKKKLLEILRDKKGTKSKVSVDVHFQ